LEKFVEVFFGAGRQLFHDLHFIYQVYKAIAGKAASEWTESRT
jgi:hypothetical protein